MAKSEQDLVAELPPELVEEIGGSGWKHEKRVCPSPVSDQYEKVDCVNPNSGCTVCERDLEDAAARFESAKALLGRKQ